MGRTLVEGGNHLQAEGEVEGGVPGLLLGQENVNGEVTLAPYDSWSDGKRQTQHVKAVETSVSIYCALLRARNFL